MFDAALEPSPRRAHFQMFAPLGLVDIRWRLLSGNNREIGRSSNAYPDIESCLLEIKTVAGGLVRFEHQVRRKEAQMWQWTLAQAGETVVIGAHLYDRRVRCEQAMEQFVDQARDARWTDTVTIVTHRRWTHHSTGHSPMETGIRSRLPGQAS